MYLIQACFIAGVLGHQLSVFVAVPSAPGNFEQRKAVRLTWPHSRQVKKNNVTVRFVVGGGSGGKLSHLVDDLVKEEAEKFGDLIFLDMKDSYKGLAVKTFKIMELGAQSGARWIIKLDDDVMPRMDAIMAVLRQNDDTREPVYVGKFWDDNKPERDPKNEEYYVSREDYAQNSFPKYANGPCYIVNRELALSLAPMKPHMFLEDVAVGLAVNELEREGQNVNFVSIILGGTGATPEGCTRRWAHYYHKFSPDAMRCMWRKLDVKPDGVICCSCWDLPDSPRCLPLKWTQERLNRDLHFFDPQQAALDNPHNGEPRVIDLSPFRKQMHKDQSQAPPLSQKKVAWAQQRLDRDLHFFDPQQPAQQNDADVVDLTPFRDHARLLRR